ncbi:hypothetical protein OSTOST_18166, partial [Ostertagia ostertagi]
HSSSLTYSSSYPNHECSCTCTACGSGRQRPDLLNPRSKVQLHASRTSSIGKKHDELMKAADRIYEQNPQASRRSMLELNGILAERREAIESSLSKHEKEELSKRLENFKRRNVDEVQPRGDSIEEINRKSGVADALFQGDIILSKEQQEQLVADLTQFDPNGRHKMTRATLVIDGREARTAFKKAAQLWMDDTCIDFQEYRGNNYEKLDVLAILHWLLLFR